MTIGGTGGSRNRERKGEPESSEEELVFMGVGDKKRRDGDLEGSLEGGILKKTEFKVTERSRDGDTDLDIESDFGEQDRARDRDLERPWERIPHAS